MTSAVEPLPPSPEANVPTTQRAPPPSSSPWSTSQQPAFFSRVLEEAYQRGLRGQPLKAATLPRHDQGAADVIAEAHYRGLRGHALSPATLGTPPGYSAVVGEGKTRSRYMLTTTRTLL